MTYGVVLSSQSSYPNIYVCDKVLLGVLIYQELSFQ